MQYFRGTVSTLLCIGWCLLIFVPFSFCDVYFYICFDILTFLFFFLSCATQKVPVIRKTRWPGLDIFYWESEAAGSVQAEWRTLFTWSSWEPLQKQESSRSCSITLNINNTLDYQSLRLGSNWRHLNQNWKKWRQREDKLQRYLTLVSVEGNKIGYFEIRELWDHEVRNVLSDLFHWIASDWNVKMCLVNRGGGATISPWLLLQVSYWLSRNSPTLA